MSFVKGARLVRHGESARGAWVLRAGGAQAVVTLPGGDALVVATLGAGAIFGEMALIESGTCTATVSATENLDGWFIEREDLRALVAQRAPAALRVQHAVTLVLAERLRELNRKVLEVECAEDRPAQPAPAPLDPLAGMARSRRVDFDYRAFLPRLPFFDTCDEAEIDEIVAGAQLLELPRGHDIFVPGQPADACYLVVRGAVEVRARHATRERRLAVLGPGQLVGYMSLLERGAHGALARAREQVLLLEFPAQAFDALYFGTTAASARLHRAIERSLMQSLARTNRQLTRLLSQSRLRAARPVSRQLELAYFSQLWAEEGAA